MFSPRSRLLRLIAVASLAGLLAAADLFLSRSSLNNAVSPRAPRLLVLVVFDQLRGDYVDRWQSLFGNDGFNRLMHDGAWFKDCHYPYAYTVTGAGHASLLTGCSPDRHGIVANEWFERRLGRVVNCVDSERHEQVPAAQVTQVDGSRKARMAGASPERLLAPTLAEDLKQATGGRARVVSLSFKDRSAILPAGRRADACYWLDGDSGQFVTSTYYRGRVHGWVAALNRAEPLPANRWFGHDWERLRPDIDYVRYSGPDDVQGEGTGQRQGRTFPHPMTGGTDKPGRAYYLALFNSPFGNELLLDFAKRAIDAEHLGNGPAPDLLCISFSSNDAIGHVWGPDSQEVLDVTLRSDLIVRDLLEHLDARVGPDRYLLALTADHGICPLPEVSRSKSLPHHRYPPVPVPAERIAADGIDGLANRANRFLNESFAGEGREGNWFDAVLLPWLWLSESNLRERGLDSATVARKLTEWLARQPGIQAAYTRAQLTEPLSPGDELGQSVRRSFHPDRCGDVYVVIQPYHLFLAQLSTGTNHGTPHPYDTHVPLLVYGPGIAGGPRSERVTPQAIAATFAHYLGIPPPAAAEAQVPASLFGEPELK
jgi:predicted AlkP superfamily pyrophosphatase or phosphodiesterase